MTNSFFEHYYTASKTKNGLFSLDFSNELTDDEVKELESKVLYIPPREFNSSPSDIEIKNRFPVCRAFFRLSSGRSVFLNSVYLGKAHHTPDRYGNFFSHSLIQINDNNFPSVFIFELSPFKTEFTIEEDENYTPCLTRKELEIDTSDENYRKVFKEFTKALSFDNRLPLFLKSIDLIIEGVINNKGSNITLLGSNESITKVILALNFFLPPQISKNISFATYVDSPTKYPFHITGLLPECGILDLDPAFFTLLSIDDKHEYFQPYTKKIEQIILRADDDSFHDYVKLLDYFQQLNLRSPNELNLPVELMIFKERVAYVTLADYYKISNLLKDEKLKLEFLEFISGQNLQIYFEIVREELSSRLSKCATFEEGFVSLLHVYNQYFKGNEDFINVGLYQIFELFRSSLPTNYKSYASLRILLDIDCISIGNHHIKDKIIESEDCFDDLNIPLDQKLGWAIKLHEKYNLSSFASEFPTIMKYLRSDELMNAANKGNLFKSLSNYKKNLMDLKSSERIKVFVTALNNENNKSQFDLSFSKYLRIISEFFPENETQFWSIYFDENKGFEYKFSKYSLEYLKKKFIVAVFTNELSNKNLIKEIKLDDYCLRWIQEEITETANKSTILEDFYGVYGNNHEVKKRWWNFI